jgi:hypothetical protein
MSNKKWEEEFTKYTRGQRSLGIAITKETYDYQDYYIYLNLWWWNFTFVFLRFSNLK